MKYFQTKVSRENKDRYLVNKSEDLHIIFLLPVYDQFVISPNVDGWVMYEGASLLSTDIRYNGRFFYLNQEASRGGEGTNGPPTL